MLVCVCCNSKRLKQRLLLTALVGRLGSGPLAAVGLSGTLFNFCNFLFSFLMIVTTPKVAAAVSRNELDQVHSYVMHMLFIQCGMCLLPNTHDHQRYFDAAS